MIYILSVVFTYSLAFVSSDCNRGCLSMICPRYPNPSAFTYEKRLFCPFEYALQPPHWYKNDSIAVDKPELPEGVKELKDYDGPQCFLIPGNHGEF